MKMIGKAYQCERSKTIIAKHKQAVRVVLVWCINLLYP